MDALSKANPFDVSSEELPVYLVGARSDCDPGVHIRSLDYASFVKRTVFEIPSTLEQEQRFWGFITNQLGKPYDRWAILGFITGRNWRETDSWICSELQAAALEYAGIAGPFYLSTYKIDPSTLANTVSAIKGTTFKDV